MPIDTTVADSPGWWMARLALDLTGRRSDLQKLMDRYNGDAPTPMGATAAAEEAYRRFRKQRRVNWAGKIVRARRDRLQFTGFRTGATADANGDVEAAAMMARSRMEVEALDFYTRLLVMGRCPLMTELVDGKAMLTVEDPRQMIVIYDPLRPGLVHAALKLFHDDVRDEDVIVLHRPGRMWRATRKRKNRGGAVTFSASGFDWDPDFGGVNGKTTGISRVPAVEAVLEDGQGVFQRHCDLLDALDQQAFQRAVIGVIQAFRQRALEVPDGADEDENGELINWADILENDPNALWIIPAGAKFWESQLVDMRQLVEVEKHDFRVLADVTSTPLRSFNTDAAGGSAEGAASQKEDLVFDVEVVQVRAGATLCDGASLGFELQGDLERAKRELITILWRDPARRSLQEITDGWSKTQDMDERLRYTMVAGLSPAEYAVVQVSKLQTAMVRSLVDGEDDAPIEDVPDPELVGAA